MSKELATAAEALISAIDTCVLAKKKFRSAQGKRETLEQKERFQQRKKALVQAENKLGQAKRDVRLLVNAERQKPETLWRRLLRMFGGPA